MIIFSESQLNKMNSSFRRIFNEIHLPYLTFTVHVKKVKNMNTIYRTQVTLYKK